MNQVSHVKEWANPTPAALVALALICFCFFALLTGRISHDATPLLAIWLGCAFIVQLVAAIIDLKEGNISGGNVFLYFSCFFMLATGLEMFLKFYMAHAGIALDPRVDGWAWLVLSLALWLWTPAFFKAPLLLTLIVILVDIATLVVAFMDLGIIAATNAPIAGWCLLFTGIIGLYLCSAMVVNGVYGRKVYPLPGPIIKAKAPSIPESVKDAAS